MSTLYHLYRVSDGAYWRPEGQGYTDKVSEAGRFMRLYAEETVASTHGENRMEEAKPLNLKPYRVVRRFLSGGAIYYEAYYHAGKPTIVETADQIADILNEAYQKGVDTGHSLAIQPIR